MGKRKIFGPEKISHRRLKAVLLTLSTFYCLGLAYCYWMLPDSMAAVTFWPAWLWAIPGVFLLIFGANNKKRRMVLFIAALWLAFLCIFAEEVRVLIPHQAVEGLEAARKNGNGFRIISLNLGGGNADAAEELAQYKPDIVLLQESPSRKEVREYAKKLFGKDATTVYGIDVSVIARGTATPAVSYVNRQSFVTSTLIRLKSGLVVDVSSVRLSPPDPPWRLLKPSCWRKQAAICKEHRCQLEAVMKHVGHVKEGIPVVVGGDFNGPWTDGCLRTLQPFLHDCYRQGGRGLGNTIMNDLPVARYDQVWASSRLKAVSVVTKKTLYSDHRAVICDLVLEGNNK